MGAVLRKTGENAPSTVAQRVGRSLLLDFADRLRLLFIGMNISPGDYEKLGQFYLGREYHLATQQVAPELVLY